MRSPKRNQQTWPWADIIAATGETDASLRRKQQRGQVQLRSTKSGRTEATLWDIAVLRLARHLCDVGFEADGTFKLAQAAVKHAYRDLMTGAAAFGETQGEQQPLLYLVSKRTSYGPIGPQFVTVDPDAPEVGLRELFLQVSDPSNVVVPVQKLISDAWYSLPYLRDDVAGWLRASNRKTDDLMGSFSNRGAQG